MHTKNGQYHFWSKKVISIVICALFALEQIGYPQTSPVVFPSDLAVIKESAQFSKPLTIINIQDTHDNLSAQGSIADLLGYLTGKFQIRTIGIEGAEGELDLGLMRRFSDKDSRQKASHELMKDGFLSASEFFAINGEKDVAVVGMDDQKLYQENLFQYLELYSKNQELSHDFERMKQSVIGHSEKLYAPSVKALLSNGILNVDSGKAFAARWDVVTRLAKEAGVDASAFDQIKMLADAFELETQIDFTAVNDQLQHLTSEFSTRLSRRRLTDFLQKSLEFNSGRLSRASFASFLVKMAESSGFSVESYKDLVTYSRYMELYESIDLLKLREQANRFEDKILQKLFRSQKEKFVHEWQRKIELLEDVFFLRLSSERFREYRSHPAGMETGDFDAFLGTLDLGEAERKEFLDLYGRLMKEMPEFVRFYELAEKRNEKLLANTIARMRESGQTMGLLVTGGFHSQGISELMKRDRVSHLVVMPRFNTESKRPYYTILEQTGHSLKTDGERLMRDELSLKASVYFYAYAARRIYVENQNLSPEQINALIQERLSVLFKEYSEAETASQLGASSSVVEKISAPSGASYLSPPVMASGTGPTQRFTVQVTGDANVMVLENGTHSATVTFDADNNIQTTEIRAKAVQPHIEQTLDRVTDENVMQERLQASVEYYGLMEKAKVQIDAAVSAIEDVEGKDFYSQAGGIAEVSGPLNEARKMLELAAARLQLVEAINARMGENAPSDMQKERNDFRAQADAVKATAARLAQIQEGITQSQKAPGSGAASKAVKVRLSDSKLRSAVVQDSVNNAAEKKRLLAVANRLAASINEATQNLDSDLQADLADELFDALMDDNGQLRSTGDAVMDQAVRQLYTQLGPSFERFLYRDLHRLQELLDGTQDKRELAEEIKSAIREKRKLMAASDDEEKAATQRLTVTRRDGSTVAMRLKAVEMFLSEYDALLIEELVEDASSEILRDQVIGFLDNKAFGEYFLIGDTWVSRSAVNRWFAGADARLAQQAARSAQRAGETERLMALVRGTSSAVADLSSLSSSAGLQDARVSRDALRQALKVELDRNVVESGLRDVIAALSRNQIEKVLERQKEEWTTRLDALPQTTDASYAAMASLGLAPGNAQGWADQAQWSGSMEPSQIQEQISSALNDVVVHSQLENEEIVEISVAEDHTAYLKKIDAGIVAVTADVLGVLQEEASGFFANLSESLVLDGTTVVSSRPLLITGMDGSTHLFEDHFSNGLIGVNTVAFGAARARQLGSLTATQRTLFYTGLVHEVWHEQSDLDRIPSGEMTAEEIEKIRDKAVEQEGQRLSKDVELIYAMRQKFALHGEPFSIEDLAETADSLTGPLPGTSLSLSEVLREIERVKSSNFAEVVSESAAKGDTQEVLQILRNEIEHRKAAYELAMHRYEGEKNGSNFLAVNETRRQLELYLSQIDASLQELREAYVEKRASIQETLFEFSAAEGAFSPQERHQALRAIEDSMKNWGMDPTASFVGMLDDILSGKVEDVRVVPATMKAFREWADERFRMDEQAIRSDIAQIAKEFPRLGYLRNDALTGERLVNDRNRAANRILQGIGQTTSMEALTEARRMSPEAMRKYFEGKADALSKEDALFERYLEVRTHELDEKLVLRNLRGIENDISRSDKQKLRHLIDIYFDELEKGVKSEDAQAAIDGRIPKQQSFVGFENESVLKLEESIDRYLVAKDSLLEVAAQDKNDSQIPELERRLEEIRNEIRGRLEEVHAIQSLSGATTSTSIWGRIHGILHGGRSGTPSRLEDIESLEEAVNLFSAMRIADREIAVLDETLSVEDREAQKEQVREEYETLKKYYQDRFSGPVEDARSRFAAEIAKRKASGGRFSVIEAFVIAEKAFELSLVEDKSNGLAHAPHSFRPGQKLMLMELLQGNSVALGTGAGKTFIAPAYHMARRLIHGARFRGKHIVENRDAVKQAYSESPEADSAMQRTVRNMYQLAGMEMFDAADAFASKSDKNREAKITAAHKNADVIVIIDTISNVHLLNEAKMQAHNGNSALYDAFVSTTHITMDEFHKFLTSKDAGIIADNPQEVSVERVETLLSEVIHKVAEWDEVRGNFRLRWGDSITYTTESEYEKLTKEYVTGDLRNEKRIIVNTDTQSVRVSRALLQTLRKEGVLLHEFQSVVQAIHSVKGHRWTVAQDKETGKDKIAPAGPEGASPDSNFQDIVFAMTLALRENHGGRTEDGLKRAASMVTTSPVSMSSAIAQSIRVTGALIVGFSGTLQGLEALQQYHIGKSIVNISGSQLDERVSYDPNHDPHAKSDIYLDNAEGIKQFHQSIQDSLDEKVTVGLAISAADRDALHWYKNNGLSAENYAKVREFIQWDQNGELTDVQREEWRALSENALFKVGGLAAEVVAIDAEAENIDAIVNSPWGKNGTPRVIVMTERGWTGRDYKQLEQLSKKQSIHLAVYNANKISASALVQLIGRAGRNNSEPTARRRYLVQQKTLDDSMKDLQKDEIRKDFRMKLVQRRSYNPTMIDELLGILSEFEAGGQAALDLTRQLKLNAQYRELTSEISDGARHAISENFRNEIEIQPLDAAIRRAPEGRLKTILQKAFRKALETQGEGHDLELRARTANAGSSYTMDAARQSVHNAVRYWEMVVEEFDHRKTKEKAKSDGKKREEDEYQRARTTLEEFKRIETSLVGRDGRFVLQSRLAALRGDPLSIYDIGSSEYGLSELINRLMLSSLALSERNIMVSSQNTEGFKGTVRSGSMRIKTQQQSANPGIVQRTTQEGTRFELREVTVSNGQFYVRMKGTHDTVTPGLGLMSVKSPDGLQSIVLQNQDDSEADSQLAMEFDASPELTYLLSAYDGMATATVQEVENLDGSKDTVFVFNPMAHEISSLTTLQEMSTITRMPQGLLSEIAKAELGIAVRPLDTMEDIASRKTQSSNGREFWSGEQVSKLLLKRIATVFQIVKSPARQMSAVTLTEADRRVITRLAPRIREMMGATYRFEGGNLSEIALALRVMAGNGTVEERSAEMAHWVEAGLISQATADLIRDKDFSALRKQMSDTLKQLFHASKELRFEFEETRRKNRNDYEAQREKYDQDFAIRQRQLTAAIIASGFIDARTAGEPADKLTRQLAEAKVLHVTEAFERFMRRYAGEDDEKKSMFRQIGEFLNGWLQAAHYKLRQTAVLVFPVSLSGRMQYERNPEEEWIFKRFPAVGTRIARFVSETKILASKGRDFFAYIPPDDWRIEQKFNQWKRDREFQPTAFRRNWSPDAQRKMPLLAERVAATREFALQSRYGTTWEWTANFDSSVSSHAAILGYVAPELGNNKTLDRMRAFSDEQLLPALIRRIGIDETKAKNFVQSKMDLDRLRKLNIVLDRLARMKDPFNPEQGLLIETIRAELDREGILIAENLVLMLGLLGDLDPQEVQQLLEKEDSEVQVNDILKQIGSRLTKHIRTLNALDPQASSWMDAGDIVGLGRQDIPELWSARMAATGMAPPASASNILADLYNLRLTEHTDAAGVDWKAVTDAWQDDLELMAAAYPRSAPDAGDFFLYASSRVSETSEKIYLTDLAMQSVSSGAAGAQETAARLSVHYGEQAEQAKDIVDESISVEEAYHLDRSESNRALLEGVYERFFMESIEGDRVERERAQGSFNRDSFEVYRYIAARRLQDLGRPGVPGALNINQLRKQAQSEVDYRLFELENAALQHDVNRALGKTLRLLVELPDVDRYFPELAHAFALHYKRFFSPSLEMLYQSASGNELSPLHYSRLMQLFYRMNNQALSTEELQRSGEILDGRPTTSAFLLKEAYEEVIKAAARNPHRYFIGTGIRNIFSSINNFQTVEAEHETRLRTRDERVQDRENTPRFLAILDAVKGIFERWRNAHAAEVEKAVHLALTRDAITGWEDFESMVRHMTHTLAINTYEGSFEAIEISSYPDTVLKVKIPGVERKIEKEFGAFLRLLPEMKRVNQRRSPVLNQWRESIQEIFKEEVGLTVLGHSIREVPVFMAPRQSIKTSVGFDESQAQAFFLEGAGVVVIPVDQGKDGKWIPSTELKPALLMHEMLHAIAYDFANHDMREGFVTYLAALWSDRYVNRFPIGMDFQPITLTSNGAESQRQLYPRAQKTVRAWMGATENPLTEVEVTNALMRGSFDEHGIYGILELARQLRLDGIDAVWIENVRVSVNDLLARFGRMDFDDADVDPIYVRVGIDADGSYRLMPAPGAEKLDMRLRVFNEAAMGPLFERAKNFLSFTFPHFVELFREGKATLLDEERMTRLAAMIHPEIETFVKRFLEIKDRRGDREDQEKLTGLITSLNGAFQSLGLQVNAEFDGEKNLAFLNGFLIDSALPGEVVKDDVSRDVPTYILTDLGIIENRSRNNAVNRSDDTFVTQFRGKNAQWTEHTLMPVASGEKREILAALDIDLAPMRDGEKGEMLYLDNYGRLRLTEEPLAVKRYPHVHALIDRINQDVWVNPIRSGARMVERAEYLEHDPILRRAVLDRIQAVIKRQQADIDAEMRLLALNGTYDPKSGMSHYLTGNVEPVLKVHELRHKTDDWLKVSKTLQARKKEYQGDTVKIEVVAHLTELAHPETAEYIGFTLFKLYGLVRLGNSGLAYKKVGARIFSELSGISYAELMRSEPEVFHRLSKILSKKSKEEIQYRARVMLDRFDTLFGGITDTMLDAKKSPSRGTGEWSIPRFGQVVGLPAGTSGAGDGDDDSEEDILDNWDAMMTFVAERNLLDPAHEISVSEARELAQRLQPMLTSMRLDPIDLDADMSSVVHDIRAQVFAASDKYVSHIAGELTSGLQQVRNGEPMTVAVPLARMVLPGQNAIHPQAMDLLQKLDVEISGKPIFYYNEDDERQLDIGLLEQQMAAAGISFEFMRVGSNIPQDLMESYPQGLSLVVDDRKLKDLMPYVSASSDNRFSILPALESNDVLGGVLPLVLGLGAQMEERPVLTLGSIDDYSDPSTILQWSRNGWVKNLSIPVRILEWLREQLNSISASRMSA